jgi:branched-chain amino acid transport system permease protein
VFTEILIYGIFALSVNMLLGYAGLISLGQAAFWGAGGYTVALITVQAGLGSFWLCICAAVVVAAVLGGILGALALRTKGVYFILLTLALAQMVWALLSPWRSVTGGTDGLMGIARPDLGLPWSLSGSLSFYFFVLMFFAVSAFVLYRVTRSPFGRVLVGIRENEQRMRALGYNTWRYLYICFIVAAAFGGLAGALKVYQDGFVNPAYASLSTSALVLLMAMIGGTRVFGGPVVGAGVVWIIRSVVSSYTVYWNLLLGIVMVAVVMFAPSGIAGYLTGIGKRYGIFEGRRRLQTLR